MRKWSYMYSKFLLALLCVVTAMNTQGYPATAQSRGLYPIYNKEKLLVVDGIFKELSLRQASGGVTILVDGNEKVYLTSRYLTIQKKLNRCMDSPVPEFHIDCKTWPKEIKANKTRVRVTYWVFSTPAMHEDGIAKDISTL